MSTDTPPFIALYSPSMSSGKTEVSKILTTEFGYEVVKLARPMKKMVEALLLDIGIPESELPRYIEGDLKEKEIPAIKASPRYMMQTIGTEWGQQCLHSTLWTEIALLRVEGIVASGRKAVVDDLRFPHEYDAFRRVGCHLIKVVRDGVGPYVGHLSEGLLDERSFDWTIHNNGTLDELREATRSSTQFRSIYVRS
jgi:hypothetical protein